jgi:hypothetical protein
LTFDLVKKCLKLNHVITPSLIIGHFSCRRRGSCHTSLLQNYYFRFV